MLRNLARLATIAVLVLPLAAHAEPIKLKFSLFTSDRSAVYQLGLKPFVDAVNAEGKGLLQIEVYFSGALGNGQAKQPQLVLDDVADMAVVIPGITPDRFPDNTVMELPGLFRDVREATLVHTALIAEHALGGYENFFVIGAFASAPESIHARKRIASIADLKGLRIRTNNPTESAVITRLGAIPALIPINEAANAISRGSIDGALGPPVMLFEFGISRVTDYHYLLGTSVAPLALVMNRKRFDSLPEQARSIIQKYSGRWFAKRYFEEYIAANDKGIERLRSDPRRHVVIPSPADMQTAQRAFQTITDDWTAKNARNRDLLASVKTELAQIRSHQ